MSIRLSLLTLSLGAALLTPFAAQADNYPASHQVAPSGPAKSRADVQAELAAWRAMPVSADGWTDIARGDGLHYVGTGISTTTRAEVQAQLAAWRANPVHADGWAEIGGNHLVFVGHQGAGRSRADVMAELEAWRKNPVSHDGLREIGSESSLRVSANVAPSTGIRIAALNGFTLASGLATDEARAANSTAARVEQMQVSYAKAGVSSQPEAATPSPVAVIPIAKEHLRRLFGAR